MTTTTLRDLLEQSCLKLFEVDQRQVIELFITEAWDAGVKYGFHDALKKVRLIMKEEGVIT